MLKPLIILSFFLIIQKISAWKWNCTNSNCVRVQPKNGEFLFNSIETCRLVCGTVGSIWPIPKTFEKRNELMEIDLSKIQFKVEAPENLQKFILENIEIFKKNLALECGGICTSQSADEGLIINIQVESNTLALNTSTDESYKIKTEGNSRIISAKTVFGARNGLETLSHLFASYPEGDQNYLVGITYVKIEDWPVYPYRSLLLDVSRNFLPISTIKKQIDAMAASKLNMLHLHLTDSQSFPYYSKSVPNLSKFGAYSDEKVYLPTDIDDLKEYALIRGIRVLLEIDAPAHSGNGWQWGPEEGVGNLAVCVNYEPWRQRCIQPPCGQLNPANQNIYIYLKKLYRDILEQFPGEEFFHMGGDEVFIDCWNSTQEIIDYLKSQGKGQTTQDFLDLWSEFQRNALYSFDSAARNSNTTIIVWSSELTEISHIENYLNKNRYVIQTWVPSTDPLPQDLLALGYKLIISTKNAWYLDHGFWGSTQYYTWRKAYDNTLIQHENVLGGEVCMWGELADENNLDSKIWPRAAAAAERLWSNPTLNSEKAEARMYRHRTRLISRGIHADAITPLWCYQNEGLC